MKHRASGFTLIEIIIYIALLVIILSGMVQVVWDMIATRESVATQQTLNHQLRYAVQRITTEIHQASGINSVTATSISLAMDDANRNPTVIDLQSGRLRIGWGNAGSCPTTSPCFLTGSKVTISGSVFTNFTSGSSKHIQFILNGSISGGQNEYNASSSVEGSAELWQDS